MNAPWQIFEWANVLRSLPRRWKVRKERLRLLRSESVEPVLGFGGVLSGGGLIHGGAVKLLSLQAAFPCDEDSFNVLYLVSSAQPALAEDLVTICRKNGIRFVWNQNGVGYRAWAGSDAEIHNAPMRRLRAASDFVVYQSRFCELSANRFLGPCEVPSRILLNPVDLNRFSPSPFPKPLKPLRLLAMGTQNYAARVKNVMEALSGLRQGGIEATLTIAGRLLWQDAEADVARHAASLGVKDSVFRVGEFTQEMAVSLCRSHHLLVHPKFRDPCPTVVAEALACGLPVVASDSGGLPEMTSPDCARLIPVPDDWKSLHTPSGSEIAAAVVEMVQMLPTASTAARQLACELFHAENWVLAHREIFSNLG
jgi:glycosyltransferase involved in cell wall biosynthesis